MKTFGILFCSILMFCFSVSAKEVEGDNNYVKKSFQVDDFYKVKTNGAFNMVYHQSKDSAGLIKMYGEENILNSMKVESKEGVLNIKFDSPSKKDFGVVILDIFSSALNEVENDGGAVFETGGHIAGSEVYFLLMGNGQIRTGELDYGIVRAKILTGSGDIFLKGNCRTAELTITGGGEIKAHELKARDVKCKITGNATIGCFAEENLKALITGSGTVYYNGNPKIKKNAIGVGKVLPLGGVKVE